MRILMLTNEYPNEKYPKPDWTWIVPYFCRSWVEQGHQVIVINNAAAFPQIYYTIAKIFGGVIANHFGVSKKGLDERGWTKEFVFHDKGVRIYNLPMKKNKPGGKYREKQLYNQVEKIKIILAENDFDPDVITGHWVNPQLKLVYELGGQFKHAKTAFVFHGDYGQANCRKFDVQQYLDGVGKIGFRNLSALREAETYLDIRNVAFICPSGVPDEYIFLPREEKIICESKIEILSAGRLVEYKNFPALINACSKAFGKGEYKLIIAGDGPLKDTLLRQIDKLNIQEDVELLGKIPRDVLQSKMRDVCVFALISRNETFGLVYLEAMLQGCIVIASKNGGVDGIIRNGENGFLCREGDVEELASIFKKIKAKTDFEKKKISENAISTALEYSDTKVAERYLNEIVS